MNSAWTTLLDQFWRSPTFPMWLTLAVAVFFGIIGVVALLRAEKSVANSALAVITLLAISITAATVLRSFGPNGPGAPPVTATVAAVVSLPALSCIDDLAGDTVLAACEKVLFGSPDSAAAAVSYAAADIARLVSHGDVATADKAMTPDLMALRRAVERDRYGLIAHVLQTRDRCQPGDCFAYAAMTDHNQIAANMAEGTYDGLIARHAPDWNAPPATAVEGLPGNLPPSAPTGKPTTAEFPTSASIPPVNIMTPEPSLTPQRPSPPAAANAQAPAPRAAAAPAARKPAAPKTRPQAQAPMQLAPAAADADN
ncbi:hypothetical protein BH11PSE4_BH11PSE4_20230 [soil metagenome]